MKKRFSIGLLVMIAAVCMNLQTFAAEDDLVDEADIYLGQQALATVEPSEPQQGGGRSTFDISNSPAVRVNDEVEIIRVYDEDENLQEPEPITEENVTGIYSPNTGLSTYSLPIGTALMVLSCIPIVMYGRKK